MENEFAIKMKNRSDEELLEIVTRFKNDYQPDAVKAAEEELNNRGLSKERLVEVQEKVNIKVEEDESISNKPLGIIQKILFLIFSIGLIPMLIASKYESKGENRKYKDAWLFMKIGLGIYIMIFLLRVFAALNG